MLLNLREYRRPAAEGGDLNEALALLARRDVYTVPLAGGDTLVGSGNRGVQAVVDLQGLGLDALELSGDGGGLRIGALVTRSSLTEWPSRLDQDAGTDAGRLVSFLAGAARRWGGSVQRNRATVGGAVVVAAPDDALVAALLVCGATVHIQSSGAGDTVALAQFLDQRRTLLTEPAVLTEILVPITAANYALETVARTPSDTPIVLAAVCSLDKEIRLVLGGVAHGPVLASSGDLAASDSPAAIASRVAEALQPQGDFRGSAEYRQAMARVLAERALVAAMGGVR